MASNVYCRVTIAYSSPWSIPKQHREAVPSCPAHLRRWKYNSPRLVMAGANPCETAVLDPHSDAWHCVSNRSENNLAKEKVCLERLSRVCFRLCDTGTDRNMETGTVRRSEGPGIFLQCSDVYTFSCLRCCSGDAMCSGLLDPQIHHPSQLH